MIHRKHCMVMILALVFGSGVYACEETKIALSELPDQVGQTVESTVTGIVLSEAEFVHSASRSFYEVEGTRDGREYEIQVAENGDLLGVELDD